MHQAFNETSRPKVAVGPALPGFGSWEWVGEALLKMLAPRFETVSFADTVPESDVLVIVKHPLPTELIREAARHAAIVYCPIDHYGSAQQIDADARIFACCTRIIVHCHRLKKYFQSYARVDCIDHHVRFVTETPVPFRDEGYIFWAGVRSNLPFLATCVNRLRLPGELRILTNLEGSAEQADPADFGFLGGRNEVQIERWSECRHLQLTAGARCALDAKGTDFRQRHKPPTKAIDFIASGLPLAMNADSSSVEYLAGLGFEVASVHDTGRWLSREYHQETAKFGALLRERLSHREIGIRYQAIIADVLSQRDRLGASPVVAGVT